MFIGFALNFRIWIIYRERYMLRLMRHFNRETILPRANLINNLYYTEEERLIHMDRIDISEGFTPDIREACPRFSG